MFSQFSPDFAETDELKEAQAILRRCVHCGFCNATCPTYQLEGNELDGPRGRIYLLKQMFEGKGVTKQTQHHLDRCLTCLSCETTCPSGVEYGRLVDIGRQHIEQQVQRTVAQGLLRRTILTWLPYPYRFNMLIRLARFIRFALPKPIKKLLNVPAMPCAPVNHHQRRILLLDGCVQQSLAPSINAKAVRVLDKLGISVLRLPTAGCCGALNYHLSDHIGGKDFMRRMIDVCWPHIESGVEAIIMTASGCGAMLKDYGLLLRQDQEYAVKAERFSSLCKDIVEVVSQEDITQLGAFSGKIAFQSPCSLQHAQQLNGVTEALLSKLGFQLTPVSDAHSCCGSSGSYSILQPKLAKQLRANKLINLQQNQPELIATANIGCLTYLKQQAKIPVIHWIELLDKAE